MLCSDVTEKCTVSGNCAVVYRFTCFNALFLMSEMDLYTIYKCDCMLQLGQKQIDLISERVEFVYKH